MSAYYLLNGLVGVVALWALSEVYPTKPPTVVITIYVAVMLVTIGNIMATVVKLVEELD